MTTVRRSNRLPRGRGRRTRKRKSGSARRRWETLARKRGIQRWSSLLSAKASRLAKTHGMRELLGERCWKDLLKYVDMHYRESFISAFVPSEGVLRCHGPLEGGACQQSFRVDVRQLASTDPKQCALAGKRLELLHIDHTYDVQHICDTWKALSMRSPLHWDFGVDATKLCALLFKVGGNLTFRCAVPRVGGRRPCHHVAHPHYHHTLQAWHLQ